MDQKSSAAQVAIQVFLRTFKLTLNILSHKSSDHSFIANIQDVRSIGKLAKTSQLQQSKYVVIKMDELSFLIVHCLGENPERKKRKERRFSQEDNKRGLPICHIVFSCNDSIFKRFRWRRTPSSTFSPHRLWRKMESWKTMKTRFKKNSQRKFSRPYLFCMAYSFRPPWL